MTGNRNKWTFLVRLSHFFAHRVVLPEALTVCAPRIAPRYLQILSRNQRTEVSFSREASRFPLSMAVRYSEALGVLKQVAAELVENKVGRDVENVGLEHAVGRIAGEDHVSPVATPPFDVSDVSGYAISSIATANATKKRPVTFVVKGRATGNEPPIVQSRSESGIPSCWEVEAGGRLPDRSIDEALDACVALGDVVPTVFGSQKMITVVESVPKNKNRRFAGSDLVRGHKIISKGETIASRHIVALASAGIRSISVRKKFKIGIWSQDDEPGCHSSQGKLPNLDADGLFLTAALHELAVDTALIGASGNSVDEAPITIRRHVEHGEYDAILIPGAESTGKFGFSMSTLKALGARIRFNGVSIQPGHSTWFGTLPTPIGEVPFLGLPGTPGAIAACFRFLVVPFVMHLLDVHEVPKIVSMKQENGFDDLSKHCPPHSDCFRHGLIAQNERGEEVVVLSADQSTTKVSHYLASQCWVHVPRGHSGSYRGTLVYCYGHTPGTPA